MFRCQRLAARKAVLVASERGEVTVEETRRRLSVLDLPPDPDPYMRLNVQDEIAVGMHERGILVAWIALALGLPPTTISTRIQVARSILVGGSHA